MTVTIEAQRRACAHLELANKVRVRRSALKAAIAAGNVTLSEALSAGHEWTRTMRVADLLRVTPKLGPVKTERALKANRISSALTLEHFSAERREQLLSWIEDHCPKAGRLLWPKGAKA